MFTEERENWLKAEKYHGVKVNGDNWQNEREGRKEKRNGKHLISDDPSISVAFAELQRLPWLTKETTHHICQHYKKKKTREKAL